MSALLIDWEMDLDTTEDDIMLGWVHTLEMPCNDAGDLIPDKMRGQN